MHGTLVVGLKISFKNEKSYTTNALVASFVAPKCPKVILK